jgi:hypothetical protein
MLENHEPEDIKVASVHLSYDNSELIRLLDQRGENLIDGKIDQCKKVEE